jgi:rubrerythrin
VSPQSFSSFSAPARVGGAVVNLMKPELNDLRILKLAEMYEAAYERFVLEMANRVVKDEEVRKKLLTLATDDHHDRIVEEIDRLNAALSPEDQRQVERAALLDVVEIERASRDFFVAHADQVHDPRIVKLFRRIVREEEAHVRLAEEALGVHHRAPTSEASDVSRKLRLVLTEDEVPLREGTSDYGIHRHIPRGA